MDNDRCRGALGDPLTPAEPWPLDIGALAGGGGTPDTCGA